LAVTIAGRSLGAVVDLSIGEALGFFRDLPVDQPIGSGPDRHVLHGEIATPILKEIQERLGFLDDVGLSYLTLGRSADSLSGGESQRIRLATQIGSRLVGVLYILDEPSVGLHQKDNQRLLKTLQALRDLGNTVIVVEHETTSSTSAPGRVERVEKSWFKEPSPTCSLKRPPLPAPTWKVGGGFRCLTSGGRGMEIARSGCEEHESTTCATWTLTSLWGVSSR